MQFCDVLTICRIDRVFDILDLTLPSFFSAVYTAITPIICDLPKTSRRIILSKLIYLDNDRSSFIRALGRYHASRKPVLVHEVSVNFNQPS
jgi:hypothetical protein